MGLKQILAKLVAVHTGLTDGYWVPGGSLVFVPAARLHEIPKVLEEHRRQEYKLKSLWLRR